jgi:hypothetical protein
MRRGAGSPAVLHLLSGVEGWWGEVEKQQRQIGSADDEDFQSEVGNKEKKSTATSNAQGRDSAVEESI